MHSAVIGLRSLPLSLSAFFPVSLSPIPSRVSLCFRFDSCFQMMAKENQAVTSEVTRLVAERDDGRRKLGDALHNQATAEQVR